MTTSVAGNSGQNDGVGRSRPMVCRGVRGAITVRNDDQDEILDATRELLQAILRANDMRVEDIASVYFTTTTDLTATYPAFAARQLGWFDLALMCGHEMGVPGGLQKCIRCLLYTSDRCRRRG